MQARLHDQLLQACQQAPFELAVCVSGDLGQFSFNAQATFPAASLIKLGIAAYGHQLWQKNHRLLTDRIMVNDQNTVGGAGILPLLAANSYSVADLITLMLALSDNTATNALINHWGRLPIDGWIQAHFPGAALNRMLMDTSGAAENLMTAATALKLLTVCLGTSDDYGRTVQRALRHQANQLKLTNVLATGEIAGSWANKTGELSNVEHDAARLRVHGQGVDVVLLTQFTADGADRYHTIEAAQQLGRLLCTQMAAK